MGKNSIDADIRGYKTGSSLPDYKTAEKPQQAIGRLNSRNAVSMPGNSMINSNQDFLPADKKLPTERQYSNVITDNDLKNINSSLDVNSEEECVNHIKKQKSYDLTNGAVNTLDELLNNFKEDNFHEIFNLNINYEFNISIIDQGKKYDLIPPSENLQELTNETLFTLYRDTLRKINEFQQQAFHKNYNSALNKQKISNYIADKNTNPEISQHLKTFNETPLTLVIKEDYANSINNHSEEYSHINYQEEDDFETEVDEISQIEIKPADTEYSDPPNIHDQTRKIQPLLDSEQTSKKQRKKSHQDVSSDLSILSNGKEVEAANILALENLSEKLSGQQDMRKTYSLYPDISYESEDDDTDDTTHQFNTDISQLQDVAVNDYISQAERKLNESKNSELRLLQDKNRYNPEKIADIILNKLRMQKEGSQPIKITDNLFFVNDNVINLTKNEKPTMIINTVPFSLRDEDNNCLAIWEDITANNSKTEKKLLKTCDQALKDHPRSTAAIYCDGINLSKKIAHVIIPDFFTNANFDSDKKFKTDQEKDNLYENILSSYYYPIMKTQNSTGPMVISNTRLFNVDPYDSLTAAIQSCASINKKIGPSKKFKLIMANNDIKTDNQEFTDIEIALAKVIIDQEIENHNKDDSMPV